ncbi:MAG: hypothetical protein ACE5E7_04495 [Anaerolineae bacterium]
MSFGELGYAFVNTAGIGGIVVMSVIVIALAVYYNLTRWIMKGGEEENETSGRQRRRRIS